jgi:hypothetical protein
MIKDDFSKKLKIPDGYQFWKVEGTTIFLEPINYSTDYTACACKVEDLSTIIGGRTEKVKLGQNILPYTIPTYLSSAMKALCQLLIYRDAWWKIDGDWKPEFKLNGIIKYSITTKENEIYKAASVLDNYILTFRTEYVRDEFLKSFKDLIEEAKILL